MEVIVVFKLEHASSCAQEDYKLGVLAVLNVTRWLVLQEKSMGENDYGGKIFVVILLSEIPLLPLLSRGVKDKVLSTTSSGINALGFC